jgi:hypothetical protein
MVQMQEIVDQAIFSLGIAPSKWLMIVFNINYEEVISLVIFFNYQN